MSNWTTSERALQEQERRRRFREETPENWCASCTSLVYSDEDECFTCGTTRPASGWSALEDSVDPWLGRVVSERYLVTRYLARGANASVYIAASRVIPRSFAMKIMNVSAGPSLEGNEARKRLQREVEALGTLRNPHIVSFHDVIELDERYIAFVMDFVEGESLSELVETGGPLDLHRAVDLTRQIANGIYEAHARNLLHRDLKPSNIMIETLPAGDDFARVLDFGVMWVRGTVMGTGALDKAPVFTSPEQIEGEELTVRSDLYSIGALLFFMLTGRPPFEEATVLENVEQILVEPAPTLEEAAGHEFPPMLETLVARLLDKEPRRRPNDVDTLVSMLDNVAETLSETLSESSVDEPAETNPNPASSTSMGMVPTIKERPASPMLRFESSVASEVSEVQIDEPESGVMACLGEGYAFVRGDEVVWAGSFYGHAKVSAEHTYTAIAVTRGELLLGTSKGRIITVSPGGEPEELFEDPRGQPIAALALTSDGQTRIAGSESGRFYAARGKDFVRMGSGTTPIRALALSFDGSQFAIARQDGIQVMHANASSLSSFPTPVDGRIVSLAFSPDSYLLAVLIENGTVLLESVHTGQEFMRVETGNSDLAAVTFSSDNNLMGLFRDDARVVLRKIT